MPEFKMVAFKKGTKDKVAIGSTVYSNSGERAELLKLTRWQMPGKSGKVYVRWIDLRDRPCGEYYDHVFGLNVKLENADEDRSIKMSDACEQLQQMITAFKNMVGTHARHPSQVSKADCKREYNRIASVFGFLLRMNGYNELPDKKIREEVDRCELIIEGMYVKQPT